MKKRKLKLKSALLVLTVLFAMVCILTVMADAQTTTVNEARIGNIEYASFAEAITAANALDTNPTIEILRDITINGPVDVNKSMTIDGGEHTIKITSKSSDKYAFKNIAETFVTYRNLKVDGENTERFVAWNDVAAPFVVPARSKVVFDNCTIENFNVKGNASAIYVSGQLGSNATGYAYSETYGLFLNDTVIKNNHSVGRSESGRRDYAIYTEPGAGGQDIYISGSTRIVDNTKGNGSSESSDFVASNLYIAKRGVQSGETEAQNQLHHTRIIIKDSFTGKISVSNHFTGYTLSSWVTYSPIIFEKWDYANPEAVMTDDGKYVVPLCDLAQSITRGGATYRTWKNAQKSATELEAMYPAKHAYKKAVADGAEKYIADGVWVLYPNFASALKSLTSELSAPRDANGILISAPSKSEMLAAADKSGIALLADIQSGGYVDQTGAFYTFDGNGKTLSKNAAGVLFRVNYSGGDKYSCVKIKNAILDGGVTYDNANKSFNDGAYLTTGQYGSGIHVQGKNAIICLDNVTIRGMAQAQSATSGKGVAIFLQDGAKGYFNSVTVKNNYSSTKEGVIYADNGATKLHFSGDCTFVDNYKMSGTATDGISDIYLQSSQQGSLIVDESFSGHLTIAGIVADDVQFGLLEEGCTKLHSGAVFSRFGVADSSATPSVIAGRLYFKVSDTQSYRVDKSGWVSFGPLFNKLSYSGEGAVVYLLKNVSLDKEITLPAAITLEGNGYTLTNLAKNKGNMLNVTAASGTVNIKNLKLDGGAAAKGVWNGSTLAKDKKAVNLSGEASIVFENCSFTGVRVENSNNNDGFVIGGTSGKDVKFIGNTVITDNISLGVDDNGFNVGKGGYAIRNGGGSSVTFDGFVQLYGNYTVSKEDDSTTAKNETEFHSRNYYSYSTTASGNYDRTYIGDLVYGSIIFMADDFFVSKNELPENSIFREANAGATVYNTSYTYSETADESAANGSYGYKVTVTQENAAQYILTAASAGISSDKIDVKFHLIVPYVWSTDKIEIYVGGELREEYDEIDRTAGKTPICEIKVPVNINMDEMTRPIMFRALKGEAVSEWNPAYPFSVRSYAEQIIEGNYSNKIKKALVAMLNFGGYTQTYFDRIHNGLANEELFENGNDPVLSDIPELTNAGFRSTLGEYVAGVSLVMDGEFTLRVYLTSDYNIVDSEKCTVTYTKNGTEYTDDIKIKTKGSQKYVELAHIGTASLGSYVTFTLGDRGYVCSPMTYVSTVLEYSNDEALKNACKALYFYYAEAANCFGFTNEALLEKNIPELSDPDAPKPTIEATVENRVASEEYISPCSLDTDGNGNVYVVDATGGSVMLLQNGDIDKTLSIEGANAVKYADGKVYIASGGLGGKLLVYNSDLSFKEKEYSVGHTPTDIASFGGDIYVANRFSNSVSKISEGIVSHISVGREPVSLAVQNGKVYVACHLPDDAANGDKVSASVYVINGKSAKEIVLENGSGGVKHIEADPNSSYLFVSTVVARYQYPTTQLDGGWINTNGIAVIDSNDDSYINTFLLDDVTLGSPSPWGITFSDKSVFVSLSGSAEIISLPYGELMERFEANKDNTELINKLGFVQDIRTRTKLSGEGVRDIAFEGGKLYCAQYFSGDIAVLDNALAESTILLGTQPAADMVRLGETLWYDATKCYQQWEACASCHPDARVDAFNWDNLNDGIGNPKSAVSMMFSHRTAPVMITGIRADAETAVRKGMQFIQFNTIDEKSSMAIDEYLKSLIPVQSPSLKLDGTLNESAERGKALFIIKGCVECHPAPIYTDNKKHDVEGGTFATPTLVEVWRSAPYMYDGRAKTLREAVAQFADGLTDSELDDLAEFVSSIGVIGENYGVEQVVFSSGNKARPADGGDSLEYFTVRKQSKTAEACVAILQVIDSTGAVEEYRYGIGNIEYNTAVKITPISPIFVGAGDIVRISLVDSDGNPIASDYIISEDSVTLTDYSLKTMSMTEADGYYRTLGRTYTLDGGKLACDWPASGIELTADCKGSVLMTITSNMDGAILTVEVDGVVIYDSFTVYKGTRTYIVASGLDEGVHTVKILNKRGYSKNISINNIEFYGELKAYTDDRPYIEIVGDSITSGAENGDVSDGTFDGSMGSDSRKSYAYMTVDTLGVDYSICSNGGMAISFKKNENGAVVDSDTNIFSLMYPYQSRSRDASLMYEPTRIPDLVIINLHTNDNFRWHANSSLYSKEDFDTDFEAMINTLTTNYGNNVQMLFVFGCMTNPTSNYSEMIKHTMDLVDAYKTKGCNIKRVTLTTNNGNPNGHPDVAGAALQAEELVKFIKENYQGLEYIK